MQRSCRPIKGFLYSRSKLEDQTKSRQVIILQSEVCQQMGELVNSIPSDSSFYKHKNIDCANCPVGNFCCTLKVKLSLIDRLRIYFATGMCTRTYANRLFDNSGWGIKLVDTGRPQRDCYFLKRDGTKAFCSIYNSRPKICRQF